MRAVDAVCLLLGILMISGCVSHTAGPDGMPDLTLSPPAGFHDVTTVSPDFEKRFFKQVAQKELEIISAYIPERIRDLLVSGIRTDLDYYMVLGAPKDLMGSKIPSSAFRAFISDMKGGKETWKSQAEAMEGQQTIRKTPAGPITMTFESVTPLGEIIDQDWAWGLGYEVSCRLSAPGIREEFTYVKANCFLLLDNCLAAIMVYKVREPDREQTWLTGDLLPWIDSLVGANPNTQLTDQFTNADFQRIMEMLNRQGRPPHQSRK